MKILKSALVIVGLFTIVFISIQATQQSPDGSDEKASETSESMKKDRPVKDYNIYALPMPENVNFAGEEVPLDDPDIYERMDRELLVNTYWQSNKLVGISLNKPVLAAYRIRLGNSSLHFTLEIMISLFRSRLFAISCTITPPKDTPINTTFSCFTYLFIRRA